MKKAGDVLESVVRTYIFPQVKIIWRPSQYESVTSKIAQIVLTHLHVPDASHQVVWEMLCDPFYNSIRKRASNTSGKLRFSATLKTGAPNTLAVLHKSFTNVFIPILSRISGTSIPISSR